MVSALHHLLVRCDPARLHRHGAVLCRGVSCCCAVLSTSSFGGVASAVVTCVFTAQAGQNTILSPAAMGFVAVLVCFYKVVVSSIETP